MKLKWSVIFMLMMSFVVVSCGSDNDDDDNGGSVEREDTTPTNVRTINRYRCYSGDINALTKAYEVRRESVDGNRRLMLYDCRGTETCRAITQLTKVITGPGDVSGSCLTGTNGFGLCVGDDLVIEDTNKGELLHVNTTDGGLVYCSTNLPIN